MFKAYYFLFLFTSPMFEIVLYEPEIPPNTGNIIRLCANSGTKLHLVKPLGFSLEDKQLIRAGLDYHEFANVKVHENWDECKKSFESCRFFAITTKGETSYQTTQFKMGDVFVFGPESRGLPNQVLSEFAPENRLRIPMQPGSRSLNLSNAAAILVYEAWRQTGFSGSV
jgi:tRNA (cytidine/uridine-2'-O-)-methyltransferase